MSGNFIIYLIGYIVAIIGVAYGLSAAGLGQEWIIAVVLVMVGLGIVYALSRSQRDTASTSERSSGQSAPREQEASTPREPGPDRGNV